MRRSTHYHARSLLLAHERREASPASSGHKRTERGRSTRRKTPGIKEVVSPRLLLTGCNEAQEDGSQEVPRGQSYAKGKKSKGLYEAGGGGWTVGGSVGLGSCLRERIAARVVFLLVWFLFLFGAAGK